MVPAIVRVLLIDVNSVLLAATVTAAVAPWLGFDEGYKEVSKALRGPFGVQGVLLWLSIRLLMDDSEDYLREACSKLVWYSLCTYACSTCVEWISPATEARLDEIFGSMRWANVLLQIFAYKTVRKLLGFA